MASQFSFVVKQGSKERKVNMDFVELLIVGEVLKWNADKMDSLGIDQVEARKKILEEIFGQPAPFESGKNPIRVFIDLGHRTEPISHSLLYTYFIAKRTNWNPQKMKRYNADLEYYRNVLESYSLLPPELARKVKSKVIQQQKEKIKIKKQIAYEMKRAEREAEERKEELVRIGKIVETEKKENPQATMRLMTSKGEGEPAIVEHDLAIISKNEKLPRLIRMEAQYALTELITAEHKAEPMKRAVEIIRRVKEKYG